MILSAHGFTARLKPEYGGLIASLGWRGPGGDIVPLLHSPAGAVPSRAAPNRFGLWPLVPFANRAFGAMLRHGSKGWPLPVNDPPTGSCIHGFGWQSEWQVAELAEDHALMIHAMDADAGPYRYDSALRIDIAPGAFSITLSVTNRADEPLPFGLGLHPWFPRNAASTLKARAEGALVLGEGYRPRGHGPVPPHTATRVDLTGGTPLPVDREIALSLTKWDGRAQLTLPGLSAPLLIEASHTLRAPLLWAPPGSDFICFEPQSHAIGAPSEPLVQAITPMAMLEPGETLSGWMRLSVAG